MHAKKLSVEEVLLKYSNHPDFIGVELLHVNQSGATDDCPLHIAARRGSLQDVLELIALGANVNLAGDLGNTPLHFAAMAGHINIVEALLVKGASQHARNEFDQTPAKVAQLGGRDEVFQFLNRRK